jgi:hypothetical protein
MNGLYQDALASGALSAPDVLVLPNMGLYESPGGSDIGGHCAEENSWDPVLHLIAQRDDLFAVVTSYSEEDHLASLSYLGQLKRRGGPTVYREGLNPFASQNYKVMHQSTKSPIVCCRNYGFLCLSKA